MFSGRHAVAALSLLCLAVLPLAAQSNVVCGKASYSAQENTPFTVEVIRTGDLSKPLWGHVLNSFSNGGVPYMFGQGVTSIEVEVVFNDDCWNGTRNGKLLCSEYGGSADLTLTDDEPVPTVTLWPASSVRVIEGERQASVQLNFSPPIAATVPLAASLKGGGSLPSSDLSVSPHPFVIPHFREGVTSSWLYLQAVDDEVVETEEVFTVVLDGSGIHAEVEVTEATGSGLRGSIWSSVRGRRGQIFGARFGAVLSTGGRQMCGLTRPRNFFCPFCCGV